MTFLIEVECERVIMCVMKIKNMMKNKIDLGNVVVCGEEYSGEVLRVDFGCDWIGEEDDESMFVVDKEGNVKKV